jgi:hypothetical protein
MLSIQELQHHKQVKINNEETQNYLMEVNKMTKKDRTGPRSGSKGPRDGRGEGRGRAGGKGTGRKTGGKKGNC